MALAPRTVVRVTLMAAVVVFCGVQDRVTAAGARRYVTLQRDAFARAAEPVTVGTVMAPAVRRSMQLGLLWSGAVAVAGLGTAAALRPGRR
jgi:hypothetical protein